MIVNGGCSECGAYHRLDFIVCPDAGRSEPRAAKPTPPAVTAEEQLRDREILARGERNRKAVERERLWAKNKILLRAAVEEQRRVDGLELRDDLRTVHAVRAGQEAAERLLRNQRVRERAAAPDNGKGGPGDQ
jgi:hypothetical protein